MPYKENKPNISIINMLLVIFIIVLTTSILITSLIIFTSWYSSIERTVEKISSDTNSEILDRIDSFINVPVHMNMINRDLIENYILDLKNENERTKFFAGVMQFLDPEIYSFCYGMENGEYYGARRNEKGEVEIIKNNKTTGGQSWYYKINQNLQLGNLVLKTTSFDPRTREWYKAAKAAGKPTFSPIYQHFVMADMTISAAWPIYNDAGTLEGVLGTHIILSNLNSLLNEIVKDKNGYAIIIEKNSGALVANSFGDKNYKMLGDKTLEKISVLECSDENVKRAYETYLSTNATHVKQNVKNDKFYIYFKEYKNQGIDWVIITGVPESLLTHDIAKSTLFTFLFILFFIILFIFVYVVIMKKLKKPINLLIETAESISEGDFSKRVPILRNDEIGRFVNSFNKMADRVSDMINVLETTVKERTAELEFANRALQESKDHLWLILDSTAEAIYGIDIGGKCTFCNRSCLDLLGYANEEDLLNQDMHEKIHHTKRDGSPFSSEDCRIYKAWKAGEKAHANDEVFWRADGTSFDVEYYSYPQYKDGKIVGAVITFMDITERREDEEKIKYLSCHDSLTGLLNRHCFEESVRAYDNSGNLPISVIFADLNGLKLTNDIFGHSSGDMMIIKAAEVLQSACRANDIVARIGGDEFMILLPNAEKADAEKVVTRIKSELAKQQFNTIKLSIALGYDTKNGTYQNIEHIMENAENEMYKEKTINRKKIQAEMIDAIITNLHEKSPREKGHSENVSDLCEKLGHAMNLPEKDVKRLKDAGYYHDIGKVVLEKNIINNENEISEHRIKAMQQHPVAGYRILNLFDDTLDLADAVYCHHESWNGTGYPKGLKGEEIPLLSKIIAIAEHYDFLTNPFYKNNLKKEEALESIKQKSGTNFDPKIVDIFIKMMVS